jgi:hypothetical protein
MSDYFGNRYWPQQFWTVRYFLGGELAEGAMQAALSGAATLSASLTATGATQTGGGGGGRRPPVWSMRVVVDWAIPAYISAAIDGQADVFGRLSAIANAKVKLEGAGGMEGRGETVDRYELEAQFWLVAA